MKSTEEGDLSVFESRFWRMAYKGVESQGGRVL